MFLSSHGIKHEIYRKINVPSYIFFSPIFFASVGLKVNLEGMTGTIVVFSIVLLVIAILTKIIGCGLGAKICGFSGKESVQVGVGMVSRGEVALIVAQKGSEMGLLSLTLMPAVEMCIRDSIYSSGNNENYDYVMDQKCVSTSLSYHQYSSLENISFDGLNIKGQVVFNNYAGDQKDAVIDLSLIHI